MAKFYEFLDGSFKGADAVDECSDNFGSPEGASLEVFVFHVRSVGPDVGDELFVVRVQDALFYKFEVTGEGGFVFVIFFGGLVGIDTEVGEAIGFFVEFREAGEFNYCADATNIVGIAGSDDFFAVASCVHGRRAHGSVHICDNGFSELLNGIAQFGHCRYLPATRIDLQDVSNDILVFVGHSEVACHSACANHSGTAVIFKHDAAHGLYINQFAGRLCVGVR